MDTDEIRFRLRQFERAHLPSEMPAAALYVLADIPKLCGEVDRLHMLVEDERMRYAILRAAVQATLKADRDGEEDPLWYVRDEIACLSNPGGDAL